MKKLKKEIINFAYKCIFFEEGIILLFEKIDPFEDKDINIRLVNNEVFLELGTNVALLTDQARQKLLDKPKIYLCACEFNIYEGNFEPYSFEVDKNLLLKLEGIIEALKFMSSNLNEKESESNHLKNQKSSEVYTS